MTSTTSLRRSGPEPAEEPETRDHEEPRARQAGRWWALAPVLAPLAVFADALAGRRLLAPGDGYSHFLPMHVLVARIWRSGQVPGWNPFTFSGSPLLALSQAGVFYPPNLVFLFLPPVLANNVTVVVSFMIAGAGAYALTLLLTGDRAGAAVAGLVFGLSGFMFGHVGHQNMIAGVAWIPWALFGYELLRQRFSTLRLLGASGALALILIAGHPQMFFMALLVLGMYATVLLAIERRSTRGRPLGILVVIVTASLGLAAVQLLPTALILHATDRAAIDFETATSYSFPKTHLALLVFPYLFGNTVPIEPFTEAYRGTWSLTELSGYTGTAALCLAAAGLAAVRRDRRLLALVVVAVVSLLIALGASTPLGRLFFELPVLGQFRGWARYVAVLDLVVAVLAGAGVAALGHSSARSRRLAAVRAATAAAMVVVAAVVVPRLGAVEQFVVEGSARALALALPAGFAVGTGALCALALRRRRSVPVLACLLVAADAIFSFGIHYEWRAGTAGTSSLPDITRDLDLDRPPGWGALPDAPGGIDRFLFVSPDPSGLPTTPNVNVARGLASANGYDPLAPLRYMETVGGMTYWGGINRPGDVWRPGSDLLDLLRVSVVLVDGEAGLAPEEPGVLGAGEPVPGTEITRYEHRPGLPDAFLVGAVGRSSRPEITSAVTGLSPFDPQRSALIDSECRACAAMTTPGAAGEATLARPGTQTLAVDVQAERPALLVISEAWFPGWTATVDGEPAPVVRADGLLLAVPVGPGAHRVELRYQPPGLTAGAAITATTLLALVGASLVLRRRRRAEIAPRTGDGAPASAEGDASVARGPVRVDDPADEVAAQSRRHDDDVGHR